MTRFRTLAAAAAWLGAIALLIGLGTWQVERRAWKLALIETVAARLNAPPVPPPLSARKGDAYLRVVAHGRYVPNADTFVQAATVLGPGWWTMTPLRLDDGRTILINRGFVPRRFARAVPGEATVTGLLRPSEPGGGFLRRNDPGANRWYSRDVAAIARARGVTLTPSYFIDADATAERVGAPVGGLTVVRFANNHLVYALTWYGLAMMLAAGFVLWWRGRRG